MLSLTRKRHRSSDENSGDPHVGPAAPAAQRAGAAHSWDLKVPIFAKRSPRRTRKAAPFRQELHGGDTLLNLTKKNKHGDGRIPRRRSRPSCGSGDSTERHLAQMEHPGLHWEATLRRRTNDGDLDLA